MEYKGLTELQIRQENEENKINCVQRPEREHFERPSLYEMSLLQERNIIECR